MSTSADGREAALKASNEYTRDKDGAPATPFGGDSEGGNVFGTLFVEERLVLGVGAGRVHTF